MATEESGRLGRGTQEIIGAESGVGSTVDPVGGSEYIESLTDAIEQGATEYLERIAAMGGTLKAIETGYIQNEIQNAAFACQKAVESGEQIVVGVNAFKMGVENPIPTFRIDPSLDQAQVERLSDVRASRHQAEVADRLDPVERAARRSENLLPPDPDASRS